MNMLLSLPAVIFQKGLDLVGDCIIYRIYHYVILIIDRFF